MSSFKCDKCDKCGVEYIDTPGVYITGCAHNSADCCRRCGDLIGSARQLAFRGTELCSRCTRAEVNIELLPDEIGVLGNFTIQSIIDEQGPNR